MADKLYTKNTWTDEQLASGALYDISESDDTPINENVKIELATEVITAGTPANAARMNNLENGINNIDDLLVSLQSKLKLDSATEITVSSGTLTLTQSVHKVQPESGTADDIDNLAGLSAGQFGLLYASDAGTDTLTLKHGTGNISCFGGSDIALSEGAVIVYYDGTTYFIAGGGVTDHGALTGLTNDDHTQYLLRADAKLGWIAVSDSWSYASATTITVPSGAASLYSVGMKLRLKQGGGYKYYYIVGVADTVLTVTGGSDYTVADASITDVYISNVSSPVGFPVWFNYTPTLANLSGGTLNVANFCVIGRICKVQFRYTLGGAGVSGQVRLSLPVQSSIGTGNTPSGNAVLFDYNGSKCIGNTFIASTLLYIFVLDSSATYIYRTNLSASIPFTWDVNDEILAEATYSI